MTELPIDPALAHLYGDVDADELDAFAELAEVAGRETTAADLVAVDERAVDDELSDHDLDELVLLVKARLDHPDGLPDREALELGLGDLVDDELVFNRTGRKVLARLLADEHPGLSVRIPR